MSCVDMFCSSRSTCRGVKNPELSFHTFPKCPEIREVWIKTIRTENSEINKYSRLCSKHFEESSFIPGLKIKKLKWDAVPTIFKEYPKSYNQVRRKQNLRGELTELNSTSQSNFGMPTPNRKRILTYIKSEETPSNKQLIEKIEKVQDTSIRRLNKIKLLRERHRRALKKIDLLKNVIKQLIQNK